MKQFKIRLMMCLKCHYASCNLIVHPISILANFMLTHAFLQVAKFYTVCYLFVNLSSNMKCSQYQTGSLNVNFCLHVQNLLNVNAFQIFLSCKNYLCVLFIANNLLYLNLYALGPTSLMLLCNS